jgi:hypothetical protein
VRDIRPDDLAQAKRELIAEWDSRLPEMTPATSDDAWMQSDQLPRRARGGLAVGHSVDDSGETRMELRVSGERGPNLQKALKVKAKSELQGFRTLLRSFSDTLGATVAARPLPADPPAIAGRRQPLHIGASVAHEDGSAGSLGAFVEWEGKKRGMLSCAHVLALRDRGRVYDGDPIQQPGLPDAITDNGRIGRLKYFTILNGKIETNLDAAVAEINDGVEWVGNLIPALPCVPAELHSRALGPPLMEPPLGAATFQIGRTSGFGRGVVNAVGLDNFRAQLRPGKVFTFSGVYEVVWESAKSAPRRGDSGSLVIAEDGLRPIGLHFCARSFADGAAASYVVPWNRIAEIFPVKLC